MEHPDLSGVTKSLRFTKLILLIFFTFPMNRNLRCASLCLSDFVARGTKFHKSTFFCPAEPKRKETNDCKQANCKS